MTLLDAESSVPCGSRTERPPPGFDQLTSEGLTFRIVGTTRTGYAELLPVWDAATADRKDVVEAIERKVGPSSVMSLTLASTQSSSLIISSWGLRLLLPLSCAPVPES